MKNKNDIFDFFNKSIKELELEINQRKEEEQEFASYSDEYLAGETLRLQQILEEQSKDRDELDKIYINYNENTEKLELLQNEKNELEKELEQLQNLLEKIGSEYTPQKEVELRELLDKEEELNEKLENLNKEINKVSKNIKSAEKAVEDMDKRWNIKARDMDAKDEGESSIEEEQEKEEPEKEEETEQESDEWEAEPVKKVKPEPIKKVKPEPVKKVNPESIRNVNPESVKKVTPVAQTPKNDVVIPGKSETQTDSAIVTSEKKNETITLTSMEIDESTFNEDGFADVKLKWLKEKLTDYTSPEFFEKIEEDETITIDLTTLKRGIRKQDKETIEKILRQYDYSKIPFVSLFEKRNIRRKINPLVVAAIKDTKKLDLFDKDIILKDYIDSLAKPKEKDFQLPFSIIHNRENTSLIGRLDKMMNRAAKAIREYKNASVAGIKTNGIIAKLSGMKEILKLGEPKEADVAETVQTTVEQAVKGKNSKAEEYAATLHTSKYTTGDKGRDSVFAARDAHQRSTEVQAEQQENTSENEGQSIE